MALPPEHGGWGLLFEPILIGLIAAPSAAGVMVAAAVAGTFLARHPLKLVLADLLARRQVPRTRDALWFVLGYGAITVACAAAASRMAGPVWLVVLACALPLAAVPIAYDARNRSREMLPEICGAAALAASAWAIALADAWPFELALPLWMVAGARTLPAMVTVRARVRRLHGATASVTAPLVAHAGSMGTMYLLQEASLVPPLTLAVFAILAARAIVTLRPFAPRVRAQRVGLEELVVGLIASVALGWLCRR